MAVPFKVIARKNPLDKSVKYYPTIATAGYADLEEVTRQIEKICTVSSADIKATLDALQSVVIDNVKLGISVRLGDLGSFRPTISAKGEDDKKKVKAENIKVVRVVYTKSGRIGRELRTENLTFNRVDKE